MNDGGFNQIDEQEKDDLERLRLYESTEQLRRGNEQRRIQELEQKIESLQRQGLVTHLPQQSNYNYPPPMSPPINPNPTPQQQYQDQVDRMNRARSFKKNVITNVITSPPKDEEVSDDVETKIQRYLLEHEGKKKRFGNIFFKKKLPKHKAMDKFDDWLKSSCENECFVCDKCEDQLRSIINEGWLWIEKLKLRS